MATSVSQRMELLRAAHGIIDVQRQEYRVIVCSSATTKRNRDHVSQCNPVQLLCQLARREIYANKLNRRIGTVYRPYAKPA